MQFIYIMLDIDQGMYIILDVNFHLLKVDQRKFIHFHYFYI